MNKLLVALISVLLVSVVDSSFSQVAINLDGASPHPGAILDINSTDHGILIPRIDLADPFLPDPIQEPVLGLMVFNTGDAMAQGVYFWRGNAWVEMIPSDKAFTGAVFGELFEAHPFGEAGSEMIISSNSYTGWTTAKCGALENVHIDTLNPVADQFVFLGPGRYQVDVSVSFTGDNGTNTMGAIFVNDTINYRVSFQQSLNSNDAASASASGIVAFNDGDTVDLRFTSDKVESKKIYIRNLNFRITKIGD